MNNFLFIRLAFVYLMAGLIINITGAMSHQLYGLSKSDYGLQSKILFDTEQLERIQKRFNEFAKNGAMNVEMFKKSMGLLGIGECEFLCDRIFPLITDNDTFDFHEFLAFLNTVTYGSKIRKAKISFDFLDRNRKGYISYSDVEIVISEISFIWNFLTGEKISNSESIALICQILGIREERSISFEQYLEVYDNYIEWYDYFNSQARLCAAKKQHINVDQIEQYLKLLYNEIEGMVGELKEAEETHEQTHIMNSFSELSEIANVRGPTHVSFQEIKPKGDFDNPRESLTYYRASTLSRQINIEGNSKLEIATKKLQQFAEIGKKLFPEYVHEALSPHEPSARWGKKKTFINMTEPELQNKKLIYFGHESWNIMLNMMLGIRKSLKSHFYSFDAGNQFTEEDINCKYAHELIYKQNNKSVKQISQIFVDYSPKIFYYVRYYFRIENNQFLKSIGLENLIGNLLMGNLASLTDQTSSGKNGSFFYYTEDTRLIVRSISKEECSKLRALLPHYARYVKQNPETFLLHIYGLYKLKNKQTNRQIYFIVVNNFFETSLKIEERYDIKGVPTRQARGHNPNSVLKERDLVENSSKSFLIPQPTKEKIYSQIVKDIDFLCSQQLIEYSLLVGISKCQEQKKDTSTGFKSIDNQETFFFGIIDILSEYSARKAIENHFLHIFVSDISCLAPEQYSQRFKDFIYQHIFGPLN